MNRRHGDFQVDVSAQPGGVYTARKRCADGKVHRRTGLSRTEAEALRAEWLLERARTELATSEARASAARAALAAEVIAGADNPRAKELALEIHALNVKRRAS